MIKFENDETIPIFLIRRKTLAIGKDVTCDSH